MSRLPFELLLALRYLRPKRTFVSIITVISIIGVMLGVAVLIIVISVMSGFDHDLRDKILGFNGHLKIYATGPNHHKPGLMENYVEVMNTVNSNRNVLGSTPLAMGPVVVETEREQGDQQFVTPYLRGLDPATAGITSLVTTNIVDGTNSLSGDSVLVGTDFAQTLGLQCRRPHHRLRAA